MNIAIYGIGNFGYSFLRHLDHKNDTTLNLTAYDYKSERVAHLQTNRSHPTIHSDVKVSNNITFTDNIVNLLATADVILLAVPSTATREALANICKHAPDGAIIVNTAKSIDTKTGKRLSEIVAEELAGKNHPYALVAGGTIAKDLFQHHPLGADLACRDKAALKTLEALLDSHNLHTYPTTDLLGVEYAAAFKNVISILAGIVHGMGFSYGSETHVISRTAHEIGQICINELGARPDTFSIGSQSWGNDMWMSCTGKTRNREYGELIGSGVDPDEALQDMADRDRLVEGYNTLTVISSLKSFHEVPILSLLHDIVIEKSRTTDDMRNFLLRSF